MKLQRRRMKIGPVNAWTPGNGTGYRARCTVMGCTWRDGDRSGGDYVWNVTKRAIAHIVNAHDRRKRLADRRSGTPFPDVFHHHFSTEALSHVS